jgi:mannose-6-phosphate isomerase-like protein (cupin superfamily)
MAFRWAHAVTCTFAAVACSRGRPASDPAGSEVRSAFGAASDVTSAALANGRAFRVVPLGPMSGDAEILFGHPDSVGRPFVMRIRELPGTVVPPHTHPVDEHITVVSGTWYFAAGERFDSTALRELKAGTYAFAPAGTTMFGYSPDGAVVQVHSVGPFHIHWRDSVRVLSEPGAAGTFRFRKGDEVASPRGVGRIRQGYASGTLVQYEIEGADGTLFMAHEGALRRR